MIVAYVDDLIAAGDSRTVEDFYKEFEKSCTCSEPEELAVGTKPIVFLGFSYTRFSDYIQIDAIDYTQKVLEALGCHNSNPRVTPGESGNFVLNHETRDSKPLGPKEHKNYRRLVDQCLWLPNVRRDIAYAVKELSKFVHAPTEYDWNQGIHLLRYLKGTKYECIF